MFKYIFLFIKVIFSLSFLVFFAFKFDLKAIVAILNSRAGFNALLVASFIVLLQSLIIGIRLRYVLNLYHCSIDLIASIRIGLIGNFFSQLMISFVGGDAMRIWSLNKVNIPLRTATGAILLDRVIGFIALIILFIATLFPLLRIIDAPIMRYNVIILALIGFFAIVIFALLGTLPSKLLKNRFFGFLFDFISNSRYFKNSMSDSIISLALSFILHLLNGLAIYIIFHIYHVEVNLFWCIVLSAPIMLIATLPISFSGWGVRESVMISGFGLLGLPAEKILAVSVTLGLGLLLGAFPGIFCFMFEKNRRTIISTQSAS